FYSPLRSHSAQQSSRPLEELVLPRRLTPDLPSPYSPGELDRVKAFLSGWHSGSPCHAFAHCRGFARAAPRRAWARVSVPISGLPLSRPAPVIALASRH